MAIKVPMNLLAVTINLQLFFCILVTNFVDQFAPNYNFHCSEIKNYPPLMVQIFPNFHLFMAHNLGEIE